MERSPLAPAAFPSLLPVRGVTLSTLGVGIKYPGRDDMMLAAFEPGTRVAGVFTRSLTAGAPVLCCRRNLKVGTPRALIVNSGNANAFTGQQGDSSVMQTCEAVADTLECDSSGVFVASTGVIGEQLPIDKILNGIPRLHSNLTATHWESSAKAIMTTDTFAKGATVKTNVGGTDVVISGFAKGSGMIAPDMATMLAFIFTDAAIPRNILQQLLEETNDLSFNSITVDSDTSTSDTCLLFATGQAGNRVPDSIHDNDLQHFKEALHGLMEDMAIQVVRDGEGASKLIKVTVSGAESDAAARVVAKSIANSPLVKTAIAGEDANWGRVVMAVGKSGEMADRDKLQIRMGGVLITLNGQVVEGYDEAPVTKHLKAQNVSIDAYLGVGSGSATVWTCDLTHGYIDINADYRS